MNREKKNLPPSIPPVHGAIEPREIVDELKQSYLSYAMSVIVSRAIPDVRDGLKPVQRRILWAMWDTGLTHGAKFKKSANVVGEVLGKYHPHGDMAVYDALARMAQDFSLRAPLIEGQGNWGSIDGDAPAAMRYTESRLTALAEELLGDIEKETVDWGPNYDSSREEPLFLPGKVPNLIVNGAVGIAVGMATSIPPHNLGEVADAIAYLAEHEDATVEELMRFIPGPDFPTGGTIFDRRAILETYRTGHGSIVMRAVATIEERKAGAHQIVVTEIPYQVNKSNLVSSIAELVAEKRVEGIRDLRDESDRDGLRIVIELKNDVAPQKILNQLYKHTELQKSFHSNLLALVRGLEPQVLSLKDILAAYLDHRKTVVKRRAEFDLRKAEERAHILEGLLGALGRIDKIIETIKKSRDREDAHRNLVAQFAFSDAQANAILEMKLAALAALERQKLEDELAEKRKRIAELTALLKHPKRMLERITGELRELRERFPSERRTKVVAGGLDDFREEDLVPQEEVVVTLSEDGYIKRTPPGAFRAQRRGGKGIVGFDLKDEDQIRQLMSAETHDSCLFFTDRGKVYQTKVYEIPVAERRAKGKLVHNFLEVPPNERITAMVAYGASATGYLTMVTQGGTIKKTPLADFANVRRSGIIAVKLAEGDLLAWAKLSGPGANDEVLLVTARGQAIRFRSREIRPMGRTAAGTRALRLRKGDRVVGLGILEGGSPGDARKLRVLSVTERGFAKQTSLAEYKVQRRGGGGVRTAKVTAKTGAVIAAQIVSPDTTEVLAFTVKGQALKTPIADVRVANRATQGVRIMNVGADDALIGVLCL